MDSYDLFGWVDGLDPLTEDDVDTVKAGLVSVENVSHKMPGNSDKRRVYVQPYDEGSDD